MYRLLIIAIATLAIVTGPRVAVAQTGIGKLTPQQQQQRLQQERMKQQQLAQQQQQRLQQLLQAQKLQQKRDLQKRFHNMNREIIGNFPKR